MLPAVLSFPFPDLQSVTRLTDSLTINEPFVWTEL